jgi:hypothetical protein
VRDIADLRVGSVRVPGLVVEPEVAAQYADERRRYAPADRDDAAVVRA